MQNKLSLFFFGMLLRLLSLSGPQEADALSQVMKIQKILMSVLCQVSDIHRYTETHVTQVSEY